MQKALKHINNNSGINWTHTDTHTSVVIHQIILQRIPSFENGQRQQEPKLKYKQIIKGRRIQSHDISPNRLRVSVSQFSLWFCGARLHLKSKSSTQANPQPPPPPPPPHFHPKEIVLPVCFVYVLFLKIYGATRPFGFIPKHFYGFRCGIRCALIRCCCVKTSVEWPSNSNLILRKCS